MCVVRPWLETFLVHSDAVLTERGCSRGATQGKVVFCHSGGGGGVGRSRSRKRSRKRSGSRLYLNRVCVHTESNKWPEVLELSAGRLNCVLIGC